MTIGRNYQISDYAIKVFFKWDSLKGQEYQLLEIIIVGL